MHAAAGVRMTYLEGELELHVAVVSARGSKKDYRRAASQDLGAANELDLEVTVTRPSARRQARRSEPDRKCYKNWRADRRKMASDIAIEVDVSRLPHQQARGLRAPGVPEVWGGSRPPGNCDSSAGERRLRARIVERDGARSRRRPSCARFVRSVLGRRHYAARPRIS